jgi:hypothetical protein
LTDLSGSKKSVDAHGGIAIGQWRTGIRMENRV